MIFGSTEGGADAEDEQLILASAQVAAVIRRIMGSTTHVFHRLTPSILAIAAIHHESEAARVALIEGEGTVSSVPPLVEESAMVQVSGLSASGTQLKSVRTSKALELSMSRLFVRSEHLGSFAAVCLNREQLGKCTLDEEQAEFMRKCVGQQSELEALASSCYAPRAIQGIPDCPLSKDEILINQQNLLTSQGPALALLEAQLLKVQDALRLQRRTPAAAGTATSIGDAGKSTLRSSLQSNKITLKRPRPVSKVLGVKPARGRSLSSVSAARKGAFKKRGRSVSFASAHRSVPSMPRVAAAATTAAPRRAARITSSSSVLASEPAQPAPSRASSRLVAAPSLLSRDVVSRRRVNLSNPTPIKSSDGNKTVTVTAAGDGDSSTGDSSDDTGHGSNGEQESNEKSEEKSLEESEDWVTQMLNKLNEDIDKTERDLKAEKKRREKAAEVARLAELEAFLNSLKPPSTKKRIRLQLLSEIDQFYIYAGYSVDDYVSVKGKKNLL